MISKNNSRLPTPDSRLVLYVDGAARGNPGPAGVGIYLKQDEQVLLADKEYIGIKTNNEAEYMALILGLEKAAKFGTEVKVISDSELLVNQVNGLYKVKQSHLKVLLEKVRQKQASFKYFDINHSLRGNNKEADRLANEAIDEFERGEREEKTLDYQQQEKLF